MIISHIENIPQVSYKFLNGQMLEIAEKIGKT